MTIVPAFAPPVVGAAILAVANAINSAEQLDRYYREHQAIIDSAANQIVAGGQTLGDAVRNIREWLPRPPPGQRLRGQDPRFQSPQGPTVLSIVDARKKATPHLVKRLRTPNATGQRVPYFRFTVRRTYPRRYRRRRFVRRF